MEKEKAKMTVTRQSNGEQVELALHHVDRNRLVAIIDIPAYNARLTFKATERWVELVGREKIDPEKDAILHVSESVWNRDFHGVAVWASTILHAKRPAKELKPAPTFANKQWWLILWQATFADFPKALVEAISESQALRKANLEPALGTFTVVRDQLLAVPLGTNEAAAQAEMSRRQQEAQAAQEPALHPSPEEIKEQERISGQLRDLAAGLRNNQ